MALCFELYTSIIISSINSGPSAKRLERLDKLMEEMYDTGFYNSQDL